MQNSQTTEAQPKQQAAEQVESRIAEQTRQQTSAQSNNQLAEEVTENVAESSPDYPDTNKNESNDQASERLTRDIIRRKALELADEDGIENLTIRKLAKALNKTPMALYRHYDSIDEIKQAVLALALEEVDAEPIPGERWDDTLRRTMTSIRQVHLNHARAHLHLVQAPAWSPALSRHTERIQKLHHDQGIPEDLLTRMWRIVDAFLAGFEVNEGMQIEEHYDSPLENRPSWFETAEKAYSDQAFQDGIDIIIAGVYNLAAPDPCDWHTPER